MLNGEELWQKGWIEGEAFIGEGNYSAFLFNEKNIKEKRETKRRKLEVWKVII